MSGLAALPSSSFQSLLSWGGMALPVAVSALGRSGGALQAVAAEQGLQQEQGQVPAQQAGTALASRTAVPRSGGLFEGLRRQTRGEGQRRGWRRYSGSSSMQQQRAYASQPAYAYDHEEPDHDGDSHDLAPCLTRSLHTEGSPELHVWAQNMPPWEAYRELRSWKICQYRREIFHFDQWVYSGQPAAIPVIGRSRFDPPTLHGPWMRPGVTHEELAQHVEALAALPRQELGLPLADDSFSGGMLGGVAGRNGGGAGADEESKYPKTLFDDPSDLAQFDDPYSLLALPTNGRRYRRRRSREEIEAAHAAAAEKAAAREAAKEAAATAAAAEEAAQAAFEAGMGRPMLPLPSGVATFSQRQVVDLSDTLPSVLSALRHAGVQPDRSLGSVLRRALARAEPHARMQARHEPGDKGGAALVITPASAGAMAAFLIEELSMSPKHVRRLINQTPWVLGLDLKKEVMPVVECLRHIVDIEPEKIGRMVMKHPRTLIAQVDDHLLPMVDYLQSLGSTTRHIRRMFTANPVLTESFTSGPLRTCVAFWLGKGMSRHDLVSFLAQYPKVLSVSQSLSQLKYDWLKEAIGYGVEDHARNPILLTRSLTENLGPRISYALHRGFAVLRPSDSNRRPGRRLVGDDVTTAKEITQIGLDTFIKRVRGNKEEFLEFKKQWVLETLPAWLSKHGGDLDYYSSMAWLKEHDTEK